MSQSQTTCTFSEWKKDITFISYFPRQSMLGHFGKLLKVLVVLNIALGNRGDNWPLFTQRVPTLSSKIVAPLKKHFRPSPSFKTTLDTTLNIVLYFLHLIQCTHFYSYKTKTYYIQHNIKTLSSTFWWE